MHLKCNWSLKQGLTVERKNASLYVIFKKAESGESLFLYFQLIVLRKQRSTAAFKSFLLKVCNFGVKLNKRKIKITSVQKTIKKKLFLNT